MLIGLKADQIYTCTLVLLAYTKNTNHNEATSVKGNSKHRLILGGGEQRSRQHSRKTLIKDTSSCLSFKLASHGKYIRAARPQLRAPQVILSLSQCSLFLIFLIRHCHASTSQGCMIFPSPFQFCGGDCMASSTHS